MTTTGSHRKIPLSNGGYTLVDHEDYDVLSRWTWRTNAKGYVVRTGWNSKTRRKFGIRMHRVIINVGGNEFVDHINGDKLDNRKANLRVCSDTQNKRNSKISVRNKSGFKGVSQNTNSNLWRATITIEGKQKQLGYFNDKEKAAKAYNEAARKYFGEFAKPNIIR